MIKLDMTNLFQAFIRNYYMLDLADIYYDTSWTNSILQYFDSLGRMMGYTVYYEWSNYDLTWFSLYNDAEATPVLHVECENKDKRYLTKLLEKVKSSPAENIVIIGYPPNERAIEEFNSQLQTHLDGLPKERNQTEVLVIHDVYNWRKDLLEGHILRPKKRIKKVYATRRRMNNRDEQKDGTYYAAMGWPYEQ